MKTFRAIGGASPLLGAGSGYLNLKEGGEVAENRNLAQGPGRLLTFDFLAKSSLLLFRVLAASRE